MKKKGLMCSKHLLCANPGAKHLLCGYLRVYPWQLQVYTLSPGSLAKEIEDLQGETILSYTIYQDYRLWPEAGLCWI